MNTRIVDKSFNPTLLSNIWRKDSFNGSTFCAIGKLLWQIWDWCWVSLFAHFGSFKDAVFVHVWSRQIGKCGSPIIPKVKGRFSTFLALARQRRTESGVPSDETQVCIFEFVLGQMLCLCGCFYMTIKERQLFTRLHTCISPFGVSHSSHIQNRFSNIQNIKSFFST